MNLFVSHTKIPGLPMERPSILATIEGEGGNAHVRIPIDANTEANLLRMAKEAAAAWQDWQDYQADIQEMEDIRKRRLGMAS